MGKWSKTAVFTAVNQFILDEGRVPITSDFRRRGMPYPPIIKLHFGLTVGEFLAQHYPGSKLCNSHFYYHKTREQWRDDFIEQYHANKPTTAAMYNQMRRSRTPAWVSVAGLFEITKWYDWLNFCDIEPYIGKRAPERDKTKDPPIYLTREVNIPGNPKLSKLIEEHCWPESRERTVRRKPYEVVEEPEKAPLSLPVSYPITKNPQQPQRGRKQKARRKNRGILTLPCVLVR